MEVVSRCRTFAALVTVVGTFLLSKVFCIHGICAGSKGKHGLGGYGAHGHDIFTTVYTKSGQIAQCEE